MSVMCIVIVGVNNSPIYIKTRNMFLNKNTDSSLDIEYLFELHASLDIMEERQASNENLDAYLGLLNQNDDRKIYGLLSATMLKILLMVNTNTTNIIRDIDAKTILKELHKAFVYVSCNNPFYFPGNKLVSNNFEKVIERIFSN